MLPAMQKYDAYKDSGVEWLEEIPQNWTIRRLKFLTNISTGEKNTEDKKSNGCYPFFVRSQQPERIDTYSYDGEAILTAGDGAGVGKIYHYVDGKFDYHQRVYKLSNFKMVIGKLLFYYLKSNFYSIAIQGTAKSTVDSLRLPLIQNFLVCFPTKKDEQQAIASYLDDKTAKIDHAISIKEKQITLLKERKQIMIQDAVTRGLNPDVAMKDSGVEWLVEIPEHWITKRLKYLLIEFNERSKTGLEELLSLSKYRGIIPKSILGDRAGQAESLIGYKKVYKGHLVINKMQAVNGLLAVSGIDGITSPDYSVYQTKNNNILNINYLCFLLLQPEYLAEFKRRVTGVMEGFIRLYTDDLYDIPTMLPPIQEQQAIVAHIETQSAKINQAINIQQQQIENLKEYRSTLINSAVTGKIKVV